MRSSGEPQFDPRAIAKRLDLAILAHTARALNVPTRCVLTEPIRLIGRTDSLQEALVGRQDDIGAQVCQSELTSVAPKDLCGRVTPQLQYRVRKATIRW
jgi:hypothetical protein